MLPSDGPDPPQMSDGEYIQCLELQALKEICDIAQSQAEEIKRLTFMVDNGLGPDDMARE